MKHQLKEERGKAKKKKMEKEIHRKLWAKSHGRKHSHRQTYIEMWKVEKNKWLTDKQAHSDAKGIRKKEAMRDRNRGRKWDWDRKQDDREKNGMNL